jgi:autotransporter-associated beta strand protein
MKKIIFFAVASILFATSFKAQNTFTINGTGPASITTTANYTITEVGNDITIDAVNGVVDMNLSVLAYFLNNQKNVTVTAPENITFDGDLSVAPSSPVSLSLESEGNISNGSEISFVTGSSILSTGQALSININMKTQNLGWSAFLELNNLQVITNGGSFVTTNITCFYGSVPAFQIYNGSINTGAGNIVLYGNSAPTVANVYGAVRINNSTLTTTTGNITITGILRGDTDAEPASRAVNIIGTSSITSTSGNITIDGSIPSTSSADPNYVTEVSCSGSISSAGDILIKGYNSGTTAATKGVYCNTAINTSGNLTFNGTDNHIGKNLTLTGLNKALTISASRNFESLDANGRITFATNNGDITIQADSDATGGGQMELDYLTFNPGSGNTILQTTSVGWTTALNTDKPYINGTGGFTFEPSGTSFSGPAQTVWFNFDQDANGIGNFKLGKINNATDLTVNTTGGLTVNGSIQIYGTAITLTNNISTTNTTNGDILLEGSSVNGAGIITVATGRTLTMNVWTNYTYPNAINGTNVNFVKGWAGNLVLSAACSYSGSTTINNGSVQFNENKTFADINIVAGKSLILGPNKQFNINGTCVNDGTIILSSGSTLLTGNSSSFSGAGNYVVEQAITGTNSGGTPNGRFWYLGSPISNAFSTAFNAGGANVLKYRDEPNNQWVEITNDGVTLVPGRGYYCQTTANSTVSFSGSSINNGAMTISNLSRSSGINFEGFNLVSNPYPSYLDWDAVTKTNISNTMWYRTASGSTAASMVFDTYVAGSGGIGTNLNGNGVSNLIPPMQSFWVRVNQGQTSGSLALDNTMRAHFTSINGSVAGLKSTSNERDLFLRMNLLQADKKDQLIVYVNETATNGFDILDGEKMMQAGLPQFYTKAGDKKIVINGLNSAKKQQSLPITMELPTTGVHSFIIEDLEISNGLVWLEDKQEEIIQVLEPGTVYEFYAASGLNAARFVLHFQLIDDAVPTNDYNEVNSSANFSGKGASVYAESAGVVVIKLPASSEGVTDIQIRDGAGKIVYTGSTNTLETSVQLEQANGIYYVTLNATSGVEVRKVFIQQ